MKNYALVLLAPLLFACADGDAVGDEAATNEGADTAATGDESATALASLSDAEGKPAGTVNLSSEGGAIVVDIKVSGMPAGEHGVHIHETGKCEAPDFKSAGGHWNPTGVKHGMASPDGAHRGDLPNLTVAEDGTGTLRFRINESTISGTPDSLLDSDGAAFIVHSGPDDMKTDPAGDSGERIACGVFEAA